LRKKKGKGKEKEEKKKRRFQRKTNKQKTKTKTTITITITQHKGSVLYIWSIMRGKEKIVSTFFLSEGLVDLLKVRVITLKSLS